MSISAMMAESYCDMRYFRYRLYFFCNQSLTKQLIPKEMPKHRNDTWSTCPPPQTPLQRAAFLDLCTDWLVREPQSSTVAHLYPPTEYENAAPSVTIHPNVFTPLTRAELRLQTRRTCTFCRSDSNTVPLVANSFAQRYLTIMCNDCIKLGDRDC